MKTFLLSVMLVLAALILIGSSCNAQPKEQERTWMDSLEIQYRADFIESAIFQDEATLQSLEAEVTTLILNWQNAVRETTSSGDLMKALREYNEEIRARQVRLQCYREELRLARPDRSFL